MNSRTKIANQTNLPIQRVHRIPRAVPSQIERRAGNDFITFIPEKLDFIFLLPNKIHFIFLTLCSANASLQSDT